MLVSWIDSLNTAKRKKINFLLFPEHSANIDRHLEGIQLGYEALINVFASLDFIIYDTKMVLMER